MRLSHECQLQSVHAVPGARKPVIRLMLQNRRVEISVNNTAASINSKFMKMLCSDHLFHHIFKFTRYILGEIDVIRTGRLSSYSVGIALFCYIQSQGAVSSLEKNLENTPRSDLKDEFCQLPWDYRLPETISFSWNCTSKQAAIDTVLKIFIGFCYWLATVENVLDSRSCQILGKNDFLAKYGLTEKHFKIGPYMIADPFEVEHNTTGAVTDRSAYQIRKALKSIQIKAKIRRLLGNFFIRNWF